METNNKAKRSKVQHRRMSIEDMDVNEKEENGKKTSCC